MNKILYFDCNSGISGDMAVGAFLDMGIDPNMLAAELSKVSLEAVYDIEAEKVEKNGVLATAFNVYVKESPESYDLEHAAQLILRSELKNRAKRLSFDILNTFKDAKERIRGLNNTVLSGLDAVRSVVHIISAAVCVSHLGADIIISSPITEGSGYAMTESGLSRVPVPCVTEILRAKGAPIQVCSEKTQLITPTGAAIVCTLASCFDELPSMTLTSVGFGAGTKDLDSRSNTLRVIMGENEAAFYDNRLQIADSQSQYLPRGFLMKNSACK